ncbi:MAG TPA: hypothetical protein VGI39_28500 [Polyangiaceae bacterium]|jgi:hypothetical protein
MRTGRPLLALLPLLLTAHCGGAKSGASTPDGGSGPDAGVSPPAGGEDAGTVPLGGDDSGAGDAGCVASWAQLPDYPQPNQCGTSTGWIIWTPPDAGGSAGNGPIPCADDSVCVAGFTLDSTSRVQGKCVAGVCDWDACKGDGDCMAGQACVCKTDTHAPGNVCATAECRTDADCGPNGECSATYSESGPFYGVAGRYCRTKDDTCKTDADCCNAEPTNPGPGSCVYTKAVGHWACSYTFAAG